MFTDTSIKFRLMSVISMLSALMIGIGVLGLYGFNHSNDGLKSVYEDRTATAVQLGKILDVWYQVRKNAIDATESKNVEISKKLAEEANRLVKQNEGVWAQYLTTALTPEEEVLTKTKSEQHALYVNSMNKTFQLAIAGDFDAAAKYLATDTTQKFNILRDTVFALLDLQGAVAAEEYAAAQSSYESIFIASVATMVGGAALAIILGFFFNCTRFINFSLHNSNKP